MSTSWVQALRGLRNTIQKGQQMSWPPIEVINKVMMMMARQNAPHQQLTWLLGQCPHADEISLIHAISGSRWEQALTLLHADYVRHLIRSPAPINAVIAQCQHAGKWRESLALLHAMEEVFGLHPDAKTYGAALAAIASARSAHWTTAVALLHTMLTDENSTCAPTNYHLSAAITACAQDGAWQQALTIFANAREDEKDDVHLYNALFTALAHGGAWREALRLWEEDSVPERKNIVAFVKLAAACGHEHNSPVDMVQLLTRHAYLLLTLPCPLRGWDVYHAVVFVDMLKSHKVLKKKTLKWFRQEVLTPVARALRDYPRCESELLEHVMGMRSFTSELLEKIGIPTAKRETEVDTCAELHHTTTSVELKADDHRISSRHESGSSNVNAKDVVCTVRGILDGVAIDSVVSQGAAPVMPLKPISAGHDRRSHAERRALLQLLDRSHPLTSGSVHVEVIGAPPCISCISCMLQFKRLRPNVKLAVSL
eukprot:GEMP01030973.1.p1 GENE.GEMP01030973.1~~GEMP01030973.1.p1  ORF type:complete len:484 (+),score=116.54 GEMP01030973.1:36-1487(+)